MPDGTPYRGRAKSVAATDRALRQREELEQIQEGLRRSAGDLATRLLGTAGKRAGNDVRFGDTGKLRVTVAGRMIGRWHNYSSGNHGDMLKLIREHQGLSFVGALDYARSYLGMPQPDYARPMSADERKSIAEQLQAKKKERAEIEAAEQRRIEAGYVRVAGTAKRLWDSHADRPAPADHPYIAKKGIDPEGLRVTRNGTLLVPVHDATGALQTLQRIWPDGGKRGLFGGRMRGGRLILGEVTPDKPVLFCEGVATGKSLQRSTGLPVVVCFSAGNLREVMREWRGQNPDQVLVTAGDNDHHKERLTPPKPNAGALTAERMRVELGAVPALPPFTERDPGTDWNDFEQSSGSAAVRQQIDGAITAARTAKQEQSMDGDTTLAPAPVVENAAAPVDPRRVLIEATALEGIVTLGMDPRAAITAAQGFVQGLTDNQVKLTLDAGPTRGWIMRADGSLDPAATAAAIKGKGASEAGKKAEAGELVAPKAEAGVDNPAAASAASTAPVDPLRRVVSQMAAEAGKLQQQAPDLAKTLTSLDASLSSSDALRHAGLRTRVAWAIMDYERTMGTKLALPEDLRREMEERMVSYPGLRNPRAQSMLRETAAMASLDLVRDVRRTVCKIAKLRDQDTPEVADNLQTLDAKIRVMSGTVAPGKPAAPPVAATPATPAPMATPAAAPAAAGGSTVAASPGPGVQAEVRTDAEGKQDGGAKAGAAKPPVQEAAASQTGGARKSLANHLLSRVKPALSDGHPPWERITSGLAERLERMEESIADRRTARVVADAESAGRAAMTAVETFVSGPGRNLLERIQTAAARETEGGLDSVIKEMRQGGKHAGLRTEFDEALRTPAFARSYDQAIKALGKYGEARQAQMQEFGRRSIDPAKAAAFERIDASLGEDAARIPGREEGKSALQELATKAAEVFMAAVDKVRAMVNGAVSASRATASPSPSPSP
ncbi:toprim domain-containing protein [Belnapia rosea]|uniref:toprim domain-containing protein n=1 Tax=Belnapia rosea TaxID=938405 RepID=UPI00088E7818|nr:toprim domain-containing protein [Belnapia rosea]SDB71480.1 Uncharacterized domain associated with phage/plasmid primase [Belnapia rosea]